MKETYQPDIGTHETDQTPGSRGKLMVAERALQQAALSEEVTTPIETLSIEEWRNRIKSATEELNRVNKEARGLSGLAVIDFLDANRSAYTELEMLVHNQPAQSPSETEPEENPEHQSTREHLSLPHGFTTEKGSVYKYDDDGHTKRWKFDHTEHDPTGITAFIEGTDNNLELITRDRDIIQDHIPIEKREKSYIIEALGEGKWRKVYDINAVQNPNKLAFARITIDNTITSAVRASLQPTIGSHVYEITKLEDGSTRRHPGHKVVQILSDKSEVEAQIQHTNTPEKRPVVTDFEQARTLEGNSIDDILTAIEDDGINLDDLSSGGPFDRYVRKRALRNPSPDELAFFRLETPNNVSNYDKALVSFTNKLIRENPYAGKRNVTNNHIGWLQHSSKAFIKDRVENRSKDEPSARIYLTPKFGMDMIHIYEEIFEEAERTGLRFDAKVYDPNIRGNLERVKKYKSVYNFDNQRTDPIVFYPFEESKDSLLAIAQKVYKRHVSSFENMHTGAIPTEIAPGFAVGSEPKGYSGNESLTSHRERLGVAFEKAVAHPQWKSADSTLRRKICREYLLNACRQNNIDPDNIAFDAH